MEREETGKFLPINWHKSDINHVKYRDAVIFDKDQFFARKHSEYYLLDVTYNSLIGISLHLQTLSAEHTEAQLSLSCINI